MKLVGCECEHAAHFHDEGRKYTPNGNPGHSYGVKYSDRFIITVRTHYGPFRVCKDCREDCYAEFPEEVTR